MASPEQQESHEQLRANELVQAQAQYGLHREAQQSAGRIRKPSKLIYFVLIFLAIVADIFSFLEKFVEATGVGLVVVFLVNIGISLFFFFASYLMGQRMRYVRVSGERVLGIAQQIEAAIAQYRMRTAQVLKFARKSVTAQKYLRAFARSGSGKKVATFLGSISKATRKPVVRSAVTGIAELVPILDLVPWYTLSMYLMYRDHKATYAEAMESVGAYQTVAPQEQEAIDLLEAAQQEAAAQVREELEQAS